MTEHFEAVIIGSGFGGSVITYRLAEAGLKVCLLERGQAYPPNSFPRAPYDLGKNFWDPSEGLYGMYNVWSFKGSGALVASGLGGGSLIYANVLVRKDEKWFKEDLPNGRYKEWAVKYHQLASHYARVEQMMNVQKYPFAHPPYNNTPKMLALRQAAEKINCSETNPVWLPVNLAVSFRSNPVANPDEDNSDNPPIVGAQIKEQYKNYHSVKFNCEMPRSTCRLCGECDLGCNFGSKNTLDYTYITAAIHQTRPADVRTLCEVKSIKPRCDTPKGYRVEYVIHKPERFQEQKTVNDEAREKQVITCDYLILAAGTFGTPFLLFKNQTSFPNINKSILGTRYNVNGDLLSFIVKSMEKKNGKSVPRRLDPSFGPVITSAIRFADDLDGGGKQGRGFYVEDGGHPYLLSWFAELQGLPGTLSRSMRFLKTVLKYRWGLSNDADLSAEISELLGEAASSKSSMPVLTMGRDIPNAKLFLKGGWLDCDWSIKNSREYYDRVRRVVKAIAKALNAEYMDNPSYKWNFHQVLTAHPLGGCPLGETREEGVVNACGEVFGYPGFYIADGSVMPGPVGPNPSLTIAAFADRFADHIIARHKGKNHECDYGK
jgi:cholesterol oxidase